MAKIERTKNAARNIVFGIILKIYQIIMPFVMRTTMIYLLGVQYLGLNSLFTSVLQVLNLAELGVGSAMVYSMYKPIAEDDETTICALMSLYKKYYYLIGTVIAGVGIFLTPFIPKLIKSDVPAGMNVYILYLLNLSATVLSYWLFAYRNSILQAHQRTDIISKITLATSTVQYGLQFFVLFVFKNYYLFVIMALFTQALTNIVTAVIADKFYPKYQPKGKLNNEEVKEINGRIRDLFTAKLGTTIVNSADTIVISSFLGLTILAEYENYYFIMISVVGILMIVMSSCTAGIGNSLILETLDKNYEDFKKLNLLITWLSGVCVCCFFNVYQPFMTIWVGKDYLLSFGCVVLMCFYFYFYTTNHLMATYKDAAGIWHEDRFRPLCSSMFNLITNIILVRYIGIFAIILSTVLSYILVNMPWLIHNIFSIVFHRSSKEYIVIYLKNIVVVMLTAVGSHSICTLSPFDGLIEVMICIIVSLLFSNIVFVIVFGRGDDYLALLDMANRITRYKFNSIIKLLAKASCIL